MELVSIFGIPVSVSGSMLSLRYRKPVASHALTKRASISAPEAVSYISHSTMKLKGHNTPTALPLPQQYYG
ncbi:hypothetical protein RRG08_066200 [Elysia crispata]|uniref:Uncharacterized protein n=1 Tax=Elysia crispata TaxID=231223 RepID=A0AAE1D4R0_9GAST|nr:hypothetical protein RRG08_066200 [Elysia crispata]